MLEQTPCLLVKLSVFDGSRPAAFNFSLYGVHPAHCTLDAPSYRSYCRDLEARCCVLCTLSGVGGHISAPVIICRFQFFPMRIVVCTLFGHFRMLPQASPLDYKLSYYSGETLGKDRKRSPGGPSRPPVNWSFHSGRDKYTVDVDHETLLISRGYRNGLLTVEFCDKSTTVYACSEYIQYSIHTP